MEYDEKIELIKDIVECMEEAIQIDSDDSEKGDICEELINICDRVAQIPIRKKKRQWVKVWRTTKSKTGSHSFLMKELLPFDKDGYKNYLRMSEAQFNFILSAIQEDIIKQDTWMRAAIPAAEKLSLTLRFLATGETFQSLNFASKISVSAISGIIPEVCDAIYKRLKALYLKFPSNSSEWTSIANEFAIRWQFPNCLGALDGKHITFRPSRQAGAFYHNYKGTNSIVLLALVDANCNFIYVDVGCNGRCNDAGVFLQSELASVLREERGLPTNSSIGSNRCLPYVVVSDDAFPLQTHLMKPYPYHTTCRQKKIFNCRLSRARHVVEHAFGILSNRFRIFLSPINLKVESVQKITLACCVLHNFLGTNNISGMNVINATTERYSEGSFNSNNPRRGGPETIRQEFMAYFNTEGRVDWGQ
uniref:Putative nuclease HARBI1 n=1 Tax=Zeugodacus cucurbitae TaxID=28588 RepID=A0A0A1XDI2_ZEUCU